MNLTRSDGDEILFREHELACPDTGIVKLATGFAEALVALREAYGHPVYVNSCCRSRAHNTAVGGHPRSLHLYSDSPHDIDGTAAIDILMPHTGWRRLRLVSLALESGWSIGVAKTFFHLDRRDLAGLKATIFGY